MRQGRWSAVQVALSGGHGVGQMFAHRFSREPRVLAWPSDETAFHSSQECVWGRVAEGSMHELDIAGSVVVNGSMGLDVLALHLGGWWNAICDFIDRYRSLLEPDLPQ